MGITVGDLESRQVERMRVEIAEALATSFAYPPFFDYAAGVAKARPVDREKREEIARFLSSVAIGDLERTDVRSPEVRRFLERLLLRYINVNPLLARPWYARRLAEMRAGVPRVAAAIQRGLVELSEGGAPTFGARRSAPSWTGQMRPVNVLPEEDQEFQTGVLQATLARSQAERATDALPAANPYAGFAASAPAAGPGAALSVDREPTRPLPAVGNGHLDSEAPRELSPDLYELYGDYLTDIHAAVSPTAPPTGRTANGQSGWQGATVVSSTTPATASGSKQDEMIFAQLRYQVEAYVRRAARSYGFAGREADPAGVMDGLRRSGLVDEADLRIAEGILALADRVARQGHASLEDYRQAFTLYLLYHRSHLGA